MALFAWADPVVTPSVNAWTAWVHGFLLDLLGLHIAVEGAIVYTHSGNFEIIWECTGVTPLSLFLSAVLAYPSGWRKKLLGLALGVPAILVVNQARLISLVFISRWWPRYQDVAHILVWQTLIVFFTVVLWLVWVGRFVEPGESSAT